MLYRGFVFGVEGPKYLVPAIKGISRTDNLKIYVYTV
jgi:hypothetical protein